MKNNNTTLLLLTVCLCLSITSCKNKEKKNSEESTISATKEDTMEVNSPDINFLIDDPENKGEKMLLGLVNQEGFKNKVHFPWMYREFEDYKPNPSKVREIKNLMEGIELKVFMGTWCEDSQREIPRLYKILHIIDYGLGNMEIAAVSHDKDTPKGIEKGYGLEYVPTIIFMKDGMELNRIVEYTQGETLEDDFITILKGEPYTPAYAE